MLKFKIYKLELVAARILQTDVKLLNSSDSIPRYVLVCDFSKISANRKLPYSKTGT